MRSILTVAALAMACLPAFGQEPTTLQNVTTKGIVMKVFGLEIPVNYTPDGKFMAQAPGGAAPTSGNWRIDGDKLCTNTPAEPQELCVEYPAGKKSGDTFDVKGAMGPKMGTVTIRIN